MLREAAGSGVVLSPQLTSFTLDSHYYIQILIFLQVKEQVLAFIQAQNMYCKLVQSQVLVYNHDHVILHKYINTYLILST